MIVSNFQGWKYWQNKILWRKWEFKEKSSYCKISVKQDLLYVLFVQIHSINIKILLWFYHTLHLTFEEPEKSLLTLLAKIKCEDLKWLSFLSFKIVGIFFKKASSQSYLDLLSNIHLRTSCKENKLKCKSLFPNTNPCFHPLPHS